MNKKRFINWNNLLFCLEIILFFVLSFFFVPSSDDLTFEYDPFFQFNNLNEFFHSVLYYGNGRIFGNAIVILFSKIPIAFYLFDSVLLVSFSIIVEKIFDCRNLRIFVLAAISLMSLEMFRSTVGWMSAAINYFMPIFCLSLILLILKKKNDVKKKSEIAAYTFALIVLGLMEQLFVEHNTIINIFISFAILFAWYKSKKQNKIMPIALLISNIAGALIIFSYSKYIDYSQTWVFQNCDGYRYTIFSCDSIKFIAVFLANNIKSAIITYCTSVFIYTVLIFTLFYIVKKAKLLSSKQTKILFVLSMLYYPVFIFYTVCYFLDVYWLTVCAVIALPCLLNAVALIIMIYYVVIKCAPKEIAVKVIASLFLALISFAPFLLVSPSGVRCCLFSYFFCLSAIINILKFAKEKHGFDFEKIYKPITIVSCVVLIAYIGIFANQARINSYCIQYIETSYYLPKLDGHFVYAADDFDRIMKRAGYSMEHEYIPLDEWLETVQE